MMFMRDQLRCFVSIVFLNYIWEVHVLDLALEHISFILVEQVKLLECIVLTIGN